jgi:hypothetical protein
MDVLAAVTCMDLLAMCKPLLPELSPLIGVGLASMDGGLEKLNMQYKARCALDPEYKTANTQQSAAMRQDFY